MEFVAGDGAFRHIPHLPLFWPATPFKHFRIVVAAYNSDGDSNKEHSALPTSKIRAGLNAKPDNRGPFTITSRKPSPDRVRQVN